MREQALRRRDGQARQQLALAGARQRQRATVFAPEPPAPDEVRAELVGELAGEVVAALRPVEARIREAAPLRRRRRCEAEAAEPLLAAVGEREAVGCGSEALFAAQRVVHGDAELAGEVAVAAARVAQAL